MDGEREGQTKVRRKGSVKCQWGLMGIADDGGGAPGACRTASRIQGHPLLDISTGVRVSWWLQLHPKRSAMRQVPLPVVSDARVCMEPNPKTVSVGAWGSCGRLTGSLPPTSPHYAVMPYLGCSFHSLELEGSGLRVACTSHAELDEGGTPPRSE